MKLRHVVESQQFTVPLLMDLFNRAKGMERVVARGGTRDYEGRILATLFYEPSTRTRFSFESAMLRLGGGVLSTEQARIFSSAVEGEEVEDSIRILGRLLRRHRHPPPRGRRRGARGGGLAGAAGQRRRRPAASTPPRRCSTSTPSTGERSLDGLAVAFVGELDRGRTARSLAYLLAKFERVKIWFVSPPEMQMQPDILQYLERHGVAYELADDSTGWWARWTSSTRRASSPTAPPACGCRATATPSTPRLVARMRPDAMILHPLPRTVELDKSVDDDPRALYFRRRPTACTCAWPCSPCCSTESDHAPPGRPHRRPPARQRRLHRARGRLRRAQLPPARRRASSAPRASGCRTSRASVPRLPRRLLGGQPGPLPPAHPRRPDRAGARA